MLTIFVQVDQENDGMPVRVFHVVDVHYVYVKEYR
jgi:hypothetical protein